MCLVIDSGILVANTYYYGKKSRLDFREIRKYGNLLLEEMESIPVMFTNCIDDSYFSVGKCEFIKMSDQVLVKSFDDTEYMNYLNEVFSQNIIQSMNNAGEKYLRIAQV